MADKDPKELAKDIERLQKLATLLNKNLSNINLDALKKDANLVAELLEKWEDELSSSTSSVESMASSFQDVVREIQKGNKGIRDTASSFNKLTSLAVDLSNHYRGTNKLSKKQLESIEKQAMAEKKRLEIAYDTLEQDKQSIIAERRRGVQNAGQITQLRKIKAAQEEIKGTITGQNTAFEDLTTNARNFLDVEKQIDKQTGIIEGLIGGLGKAFPNIAGKLGLDEVQAKMREMAEENIKNQQKEKDLTSQIAKQRGNLSDKQIKAGFGGKELKDMFAQKEALSASNASASGLSGKMKMLGEGAKIFGKNLTAALGPIGLIAIAVEQLIEAIKIVDSGAGDMAKSMNMTYDEALATRRELGNIATISGDAALTTKGLQETYVAIGQSLGSNAMASAETLKTFTKLREQAGYTNEQLTELNKLSLVNGKSLEDNTKEILGGAKAYSIRKGLVINEKQVLDDVTKASASLKLSLGGSADELARSATQARAVGLNLEQAATIADSLLQFESSIENELSAELLTGKDLNFEKARTLALNNDIAGAAEEVAKQVGTSADWANMNAMAQESIAKATGLTKDQLAQSIIEREALAKIGLKDAAAAKAKYDTLRKTMTAEQAAAALGDEALAKQYEQQSVQERFNQTVEKLKEVFVQVAEPLLGIISPFMDLVGEILPLVNILFQPIISSIKVMGDMIKTYIKEPLEGVKSIFSGIMDIFKGDFESGIKKIGSGILRVILTPIQTIINGGISLINSTVDMLNAIPGVDIKKIAPLDLTSLVMGNDVFSPGAGTSGYGSRTLLGPEGAIALNNKDTVIAGTNLFDQKPEKANDMISGPKGAITVANSTAPKKETPTNPNSETNMLLSQLIKGQKEVNAVPTLRIQ
jgi:phage-related protein